MERELPTYLIRDTRYYVDTENRQLRQVDAPGNTIAFEDMNYTETGYEFKYDVLLRTTPQFQKTNVSNVVDVKMPMLVDLDPDGLAAKYDIPKEALQGKTDYDIIVNQDLVDTRLKGFLPVVNIVGDDFFVDLRLGELRHAHFLDVKIDLDDQVYDFEADAYQIFYDPSRLEVVNLERGVTKELPQELIQLNIPLLSALDPIGACNKYGGDMKQQLMKYPPQEKKVIDVLPALRKEICEWLGISDNKKEQKRNSHLRKSKGNRL